MKAAPLAPAMALLLCAAHAHAQPAGGRPAALVRVVEIEERLITPGMLVPATVISRENSLLAMEVAGVVTFIRDVGERVEKGEILVAVDATHHQLELDEAEAALRPLESDMAFLQRESKRLDMLAKENNAAKNKLDEMESKYQMALGEISSASIRAAQSRDRLRRTKIRSPFDGVVSERHMTLGEYAEPGKTALRLVNLDKLEVQARAPQHTLPWLSEARALRVIDGENSLLQTVRALVPVGDEVSRLYELRLETVGADWRAGHALRVELPTGASERALAVPHDALVIRRDGIAVYRVGQDNIAEMMPVSTGIADHDYIEVKGALAAGDRVVVRGNERLRPGQTVRIMSAEGAAASANPG